MNPTTTDQLPPPPPPLPLQPPRSSFSCDRHPDENFSGFCPLCLCERLTTLDQSAAAAAGTSSSRRNSTSSATAALKSIYTTFEAYRNKSSTTATAKTSSSFLPELRRTKSFSAARNDGLGFSTGGYELQRKSCDVRNTLYSLFTIDDVNKQHLKNRANGTELEQEIEINVNEIEVPNDVVSREINEIEELPVEDASTDELKIKTMKDHIHIDLDSQSKKSTKSNFWSAASVLSKKWQTWRRKQKKSPNDVVSSSKLPIEKPISRQYRETQSEIADYGFGRRSCDVDHPRFSLDAGRVSFDDPRYSFDEPRASWDGYMIGRTFPRLPPMVEDVPIVVHVPRSDMQISVEQPAKSDEFVPGGSIQTREYYTDSSSRRRKSLDRSNSIRKMAAAVVAEMDDTNIKPEAGAAARSAALAPVSNAKVSPATIDYNNYPSNKGLRAPSIGCEQELRRDSNSNSLRDDYSETFEIGLGFRDNGVEKKESKKSRRWKWKIWGFIHRRGGNKDDEDDRCSRVNGVARSYSESWQENGNNRNLFRSNSSVSWRNSSHNMKKSSSEFGNGKNKRVGGDEFVLERNRSARYSPKHTDSGLLRFYLTPLRGSRRSRSSSNSNSIARNMTRNY
ncbi:protein OCTOPUS-like [Rutidosis leptorrhynchoides]|uniref:protein OCTOPUS-like n=1 Tax=Rutidosis leptorrhynchoides TaxID=125765 RepID=UPI003A99AB40